VNAALDVQQVDARAITRAAIRAVKAAGADIIKTLRELSLYELPSRPAFPPPADIDAERSVLESVLCGRRKPSELACRAVDYYHPAHRAIVAVLEAAEEIGTEPRVLDVLELQGATRERAEAFVRDIIDCQPVNAYVDEAAERVRELAEQRRVITLMQRLDTLWRCGEGAPVELVSELRALLSRWETADG